MCGHEVAVCAESPPPMAFGPPRVVPARDPPQLELAPWYMASIPTSLGGVLIKQLAAPAPLTGYHHVKRVRRHPEDAGRLQILICPVERATDQVFPESIASVILKNALEVETTGVPRYAPATRAQWEAWGQHWPLTWRAPDPTLQPQYGALREDEVSAMYTFLEKAVTLAVEGKNACLIVDPVSGEWFGEWWWASVEIINGSLSLVPGLFQSL